MDNKNNVEICEVLSKLDDNYIEIERVRDLLQFFDEHLETEMEMLHRERYCTVVYFLDRFRLLRSLVDAIEIQLTNTAVTMAEAVDKGYEILRAVNT